MKWGILVFCAFYLLSQEAQAAPRLGGAKSFESCAKTCPLALALTAPKLSLKSFSHPVTLLAPTKAPAPLLGAREFVLHTGLSPPLLFV